MARTTNGRLTGRAAAEELRDQRIYLAEMAEKQASALKSKYANALSELRELDPEGWEAWYDDHANVPEFKSWSLCQPALDAIINHVAELKAAKPAQEQQQTVAEAGPVWKVIAGNTLRGYSVAVRDFETVTGRLVKNADAVSIARWVASMKARKLASNTIRTRISAVRILSGAKYPLPPKAKVEVPVLSLDQVKAVMRVVSQSDRMAMMTQLSGLDTPRRKPETFGMHFLGAVATYSAQALNRMIKRYARNAGLEAQQVTLRVWRASGAALLKTMDPAEFAELFRPVESGSETIPWKKKLHGINRRAHIKA